MIQTHKLISLLLAAVLSAGALAGCAPSGGTSSAGGSSSEGTPADAFGQTPAGSEDKTLNVFTWDGYFPQDVVDDFTGNTGIKINFSNFESNEEMLTKLEAANAGDYDVIVVSDYMADTMRKKGGLLKELDQSKIPNFKNIDPGYQSKFYDPENQYTIPYGPGSPLIVYDPELCPVDIQGYEDLWNPALENSVVMMDSFRVVIGIALKTMGRSFNETDPAVLEEAKAKLFELAPNIRTLSVNNLQNVVLSGEASVGFMFTSQVAAAVTERPELKVVYPKEGLGMGIDTLAVPANAPHEDNAYAFLNYLLDPTVGARISTQIMYSCPNKASFDYLPDEFKNNPAYNLPAEMLDTAEFVQDVGETTAEYDKIWTEFKQKLSL